MQIHLTVEADHADGEEASPEEVATALLERLHEVTVETGPVDQPTNGRYCVKGAAFIDSTE